VGHAENVWGIYSELRSGSGSVLDSLKFDWDSYPRFYHWLGTFG
jgi:hypothetical protein